MTHTLRRILLACIAVLLSAPTSASAQSDQVSIEAEIARERTYISESIAYQLTVRGGDPDTPPVVEFPESLRAVYINGGKQSFTSVRVINGRQTTISNNIHTYRYSVTCLEDGVITIPPALVTVDGKTYQSNPITITAFLPTEAPEDSVEAELSRTTLYVNESVPLDITWWIGNNNTSNFSFDSSVFPDSVNVMPVNPGIRGTQTYTMDIAGQEIVGALDQTTQNGIRKTRMRLRVMITPTEPGELTLGPLRVIFDRTESSTRRYRAYAESDPIRFTAIPVPEEGKPDGYAGVIGVYALESAASTDSVNVGDPIELVLQINGSEPMQGLADGPDLLHDPEFTDGFKVGSDGWREDLPRRSGTRVFRTTVRATDPSVTQIPSIKLPTFDPETGTYRVFSSEPIPLQVRAVREVTIADAIGTIDQQEPTQPNENALASSEPSVWARADLDSMLTQDGFDLGERLRSPVWLSTMSSGPALALIAILAVRRRNKLNPRAVALRRAWIRAKQLDRSGEHTDALRTYLGAAIGCDPEAFSTADLDALELEDSMRSEVLGALEHDERSGFAQAPAADAVIQTRDLLPRLRRSITQANLGRSA